MKINTEYVSSEDIKLKTAEARSVYYNNYSRSLPLNAELLLQNEYGMNVIPVPSLRQLGFECAFSRDGKTILVDAQMYDNPAMTNRLCFTFAHELGHKILHEKYLPHLKDISDKQNEWLEKQARMFASEFLMPEHLVLGVIATEIIDRLESILSYNITLESCISYRIQELSEYFGVSKQAIENRLKNINLEKVLSGPYISHMDINKLKQLASVVQSDNEGLVWNVLEAL